MDTAGAELTALVDVECANGGRDEMGSSAAVSRHDVAGSATQGRPREGAHLCGERDRVLQVEAIRARGHGRAEPCRGIAGQPTCAVAGCRLRGYR